MSKICCTFALEIGKDVLTTTAGKRTMLRWGATSKEYPAVKHIPQVCGRKERSPSPISGDRSFRLILDSMKPTYIQLYELIWDILKNIFRHICDTTNR